MLFTESNDEYELELVNVTSYDIYVKWKDPVVVPAFTMTAAPVDGHGRIISGTYINSDKVRLLLLVIQCLIDKVTDL